MKCNITRITSHYFNNKNTVMGIHSIPDFVNGFHGGIYCRIKANRKICSMNIFINSTGDADAGNIKLTTEIFFAAERTIAANDNKSINFPSLQIFKRSLSSFVVKKI